MRPPRRPEHSFKAFCPRRMCDEGSLVRKGRSEFNEKGTRYSIFALAQIGLETRHKRSRGSRVPSGRRDTSGSGKVRHVRRPMVEFEAIGEVLAGQVVCS